MNEKLVFGLIVLITAVIFLFFGIVLGASVMGNKGCASKSMQERGRKNESDEKKVESICEGGARDVKTV